MSVWVEARDPHARIVPIDDSFGETSARIDDAGPWKQRAGALIDVDHQAGIRNGGSVAALRVIGICSSHGGVSVVRIQFHQCAEIGDRLLVALECEGLGAAPAISRTEHVWVRGLESDRSAEISNSCLSIALGIIG